MGIFSILIGGCGAYEWQKSGVSEEKVTQDKSECVKYVRKNYSRERRRIGPERIKKKVDNRVVTEYKYPSRSYIEGRLFNRCMREMGYRLEKKADK